MQLSIYFITCQKNCLPPLKFILFGFYFFFSSPPKVKMRHVVREAIWRVNLLECNMVEKYKGKELI